MDAVGCNYLCKVYFVFILVYSGFLLSSFDWPRRVQKALQFASALLQPADYLHVVLAGFDEYESQTNAK